MLDEIKDISCTDKDIRKFSVVLGIVLALWGGIFLYRGSVAFMYFFAVSLAFIILGRLYPLSLKPFYMTAAVITVFWRWLISKLILLMIFYLAFAPMNFIAKLLGKSFLKQKFDKKAESYWIPKKKTEFKKTDYERQF